MSSSKKSTKTNASKAQVAKDKVVTFTYQITDPHGEVVERVDLPMTTVFGRHNRLYDKVENAMLGRKAGEKIAVKLLPSECAWGEPDPDLIFTDALHNVPEEYRRLGAEVQFQSANGEVKTFIVTAIGDKTITIDGNHPFAGKIVTFHVEIKEIRDATGQELVEGISSGAEQMNSGGLMH